MRISDWSSDVCSSDLQDQRCRIDEAAIGRRHRRRPRRARREGVGITLSDEVLEAVVGVSDGAVKVNLPRRPVVDLEIETALLEATCVVDGVGNESRIISINLKILVIIGEQVGRHRELVVEKSALSAQFEALYRLGIEIHRTDKRRGGK